MANVDPSSYNAIASAMYLFEDGELLTREELRKRKDDALEKQEQKSPFVVGSMARVSERIGELDRSLQDYTQLVFDSRLSENDDTATVTPFSPRSSLVSAKHKRKVKFEQERRQNEEKEMAEIKAFSGVYSIHSAVGQAPERIKNVHKISMKQKKKERKKSADTSGAKPKFVELFTFPGYQSTALTPLPHSVTTSEVLHKVINAQYSGKQKVQKYEDEFNRVVFSQMSQAMLQDIYWWIFLEKFSTQKASQPNFFNRVSHNYINFIIHIQSYHYKETILNSIYVAFTETFPDSYKQFGDDFKEFLLQTVFEWMTGILPAPRKFLKWSPDLEPAGKKREAAMGKAPPPKETKNAVPATGADDWLAAIDAVSGIQKNNKKFGSEMSLVSRATSHNTTKSKHGGRGQGSESSRSEDTSNLIDSVADAQSHKSKYPRPPASKLLTPVLEATPGRQSLPDDANGGGLDGIEEELSEMATRTVSKLKEKSLSKRQPTTKHVQQTVESHPACKGADMVKSLFDVKGSCPLVAHYMRMKKLDSDSGQKVNVSRSELKNLPPLDTPTYRDVIKNTFMTIKNIEKGIHRHIKADMAQHSHFVIQQNKRAKYYRETQASLLNDTKEVKRLSNLLIIENSSQKEPSEKGASDAATSKLDKLFDQALQRAAENNANKL